MEIPPMDIRDYGEKVEDFERNFKQWVKHQVIEIYGDEAYVFLKYYKNEKSATVKTHELDAKLQEFYDEFVANHKEKKSMDHLEESLRFIMKKLASQKNASVKTQNETSKELAEFGRRIVNIIRFGHKDKIDKLFEKFHPQIYPIFRGHVDHDTCMMMMNDVFGITASHIAELSKGDLLPSTLNSHLKAKAGVMGEFFYDEEVWRLHICDLPFLMRELRIQYSINGGVYEIPAQTIILHAEDLFSVYFRDEETNVIKSFNVYPEQRIAFRMNGIWELTSLFQARVGIFFLLVQYHNVKKPRMTGLKTLEAQMNNLPI